MSNLVMQLAQPALVVWLLKATVLLVAALGASSLLRRASAGARHIVWLATLVAVLLLPALSLWAPVQFDVLPFRLPMAQLADDATEPPAALPLPDIAASAGAPVIAELPAVPPVVAAPEETALFPTADGPAGPLAGDQHFPLWATALMVWVGMTVALLAWLAFGALSVRRIVRMARPLEDRAWTAALYEIADRLDLATLPRLVASDGIEMPFACGIVEPTIVLPAESESWTDERRRAVLFHELAHVKRRDLIGHTLGRIACAIYWFHPLVWTAARRLRAESERACDDLVLSCGARASDYADHLLDIVVNVRRHAAPATVLPMARRRELEGRVLAILDPAISRIPPGRLQSAGLVVGLGVLALSVAGMAPAPRLAVAPDASESVAPPAPVAAFAPVAKAPRAPRQTPNEANAPQAASRTNVADVALPEVARSVGQMSGQMVKDVAAALFGSTNGSNKTSRTPEQARADSAKVALLLRVLRTDPDGAVRRMAAWGLSEVHGTPAAVDALVETLRNDDVDEVREMAAWALADEAQRERVQRALAEALRRDGSDEVRETAAWALGNADAREESAALETALAGDESDEVRETAAWALGSFSSRPAARALVAALKDKAAEVRETAAWALAAIEDQDTAPALVDAFTRETNTDVRVQELRALTFLGVQDRTVLDAALASKDAELRSRAVRMLAGAGAGAWPEPRPRPRPRPMP